MTITRSLPSSGRINLATRSRPCRSRSRCSRRLPVWLAATTSQRDFEFIQRARPGMHLDHKPAIRSGQVTAPQGRNQPALTRLDLPLPLGPTTARNRAKRLFLSAASSVSRSTFRAQRNPAHPPTEKRAAPCMGFPVGSCSWESLR